MASQNNRPEARGFFLLSRQDWIYLLSLLLPFFAYDLVLKSLLVASWPEAPGLFGSFGLIRSDLLFNLGYGLLWVGLLAVAKRKLYRWLVIGFFHASTIFVALITMGSYQYFKSTGSILDSDYILFWLASPEGTGGAIASQVTPGLLILLLIIVAYAIMGPWLITRLTGRWRGGWPDRTGAARASWLRLAGIGLTAYALFALSLLPGGSVRANNSLSRDAFVNMVMTAAEVADSDGAPDVAIDQTVEEPPPEAILRSTSDTERRNVVLIFLESTRALATTPYNENLETTPFLNELANKSLMAERAHAVVPHTHNALTVTNCGVEPPLDRWGTMLLGTRSDSVPSKCLADLLKEQGYNSVYFMSQASTFENSPKIMENLGYDEFYSVESMNKEGFEQTNYFGYEDEIMLKPSQEWLEKQKASGKPFLATYLTSAPHHEYLAPQDRHGRVAFSEIDEVNRYLNAIRNEDFFLKDLFDQYKELGLYDDTVFIILGDHGEGFGEHDRYQHDNVPYEEGLKIPMLIHDPRQFQNGARIKVPVNQLDILPTVADLLGYEIEGGAYGGYSLLEPLPKERPLKASCWNESGCLVRLDGTEKYIYHFDNQSEEVFDLSEDPNERQNLAGEYDAQELEDWRAELLKWRAKVNSTYGMGVSE